MVPTGYLVNGELPNPGNPGNFGRRKPPNVEPVPVFCVPPEELEPLLPPPEELEPLSPPSGPGVANATAPAPLMDMAPTTVQTMAA
jgi:hypothetical protein